MAERIVDMYGCKMDTFVAAEPHQRACEALCTLARPLVILNL